MPASRFLACEMLYLYLSIWYENLPKECVQSHFKINQLLPPLFHYKPFKNIILPWAYLQAMFYIIQAFLNKLWHYLDMYFLRREKKKKAASQSQSKDA